MGEGGGGGGHNRAVSSPFFETQVSILLVTQVQEFPQIFNFIYFFLLGEEFFEKKITNSSYSFSVLFCFMFRLKKVNERYHLFKNFFLPEDPRLP